MFITLSIAFTYMNFNDLRQMLKFLLFVLLAFVCPGCQTMETVESTKIPQHEIRQTYTVTATREQTNVAAYFNHGSWGKSVDLDAPSKIEDNGEELAQSSLTFLTGTTYGKKLAGLRTAHGFVYTNNDGKVFRNNLSFEPLDLPEGEIVINRLQETVIRLSRAAGKDEKISISLKSSQKPPDFDNPNAAPDNSKEYELFLNNELDENRSAIVLKPKNLKKFVGGKAVLSVEVSRELPLQEQTQAGGTMRWSYTSTINASVTN
jgi:hypothetical protein